jgi:hypothetical protein
MAEPTRTSKDREDVEVEKAVHDPQGGLADYVSHLSAEHRMLVGAEEPVVWRFLGAHAGRSAESSGGKPYIFKLVNRIQEDIERIEEMKRFEAEYGIDLADCVEMP